MNRRDVVFYFPLLGFILIVIAVSIFVAYYYGFAILLRLIYSVIPILVILRVLGISETKTTKKIFYGRCYTFLNLCLCCILYLA